MILLLEQAELLNRQAERVGRDRSPPAHGRDTELLVDAATRLWNTLKAHAERAPIDLDAPDAEADARVYTSIYKTLDATMAAVEAAARQEMDAGASVAGWDEFVKARQEVADVASVPVETALRAARQIRAGEGRPIGEVRRDLERRLRA